ncbi:isopentenyl-diphosphate delta-isomerase [Patescibacteria group bacterium]|nr:isopentenyl-diphosphate delta-isomerase [Patescibacteria group bacterium]MBU1931793.1 isopentenyl-diphosphate delta-isomerase [Patescibacteria group bacterium]
MTQLILVNQQDQPIGYEEKSLCHQGKGKRHRAFSVWVFNNQGETLIQQRSRFKSLWPLYWANTCCSHPVKGEKTRVAAIHRLKEELGFSCPLEFIYKFEYRAEYKNIGGPARPRLQRFERSDCGQVNALAFGGEHEFCYVYSGQYDGVAKPDPKEIADWRWISLEQLEKEIKQQPGAFTPWIKLELKRISNVKNH